MENKYCEKCKKPMAKNDKHRLCEHCRSANIETTKKVGKGVLISVGAIFATLGSIFAIVLGIKRNKKE